MVNVIIKEPSYDEFDDFIDEITRDIRIVGIQYNASHILKELDPIAYDLNYDEYIENHTKYECGECGCEYEEQQDAEECCDDIDK